MDDSRAVGGIMTTRIESCSRTTAVEDVAAKMSVRAISCVLVLDDGRAVGIVSERDIVKLVGAAARQIPELHAEDVMSQPVFTISPEMLLSDALHLLQEKRFRRLPVVDAQGAVIGLVTQTDLLRAWAGHGAP